jgi:hypothetical protein
MQMGITTARKICRVGMKPRAGLPEQPPNPGDGKGESMNLHIVFHIPSWILWSLGGFIGGIALTVAVIIALNRTPRGILPW